MQQNSFVVNWASVGIIFFWPVTASSVNGSFTNRCHRGAIFCFLERRHNAEDSLEDLELEYLRFVNLFTLGGSYRIAPTDFHGCMPEPQPDIGSAQTYLFSIHDLREKHKAIVGKKLMNLQFNLPVGRYICILEQNNVRLWYFFHVNEHGTRISQYDYHLGEWFISPYYIASNDATTHRDMYYVPVADSLDSNTMRNYLNSVAQTVVSTTILVLSALEETIHHNPVVQYIPWVAGVRNQNIIRAKSNQQELIQIKRIDLSAPRTVVVDKPANTVVVPTGREQPPHIRRAHSRTYKNGKKIPIAAYAVKGASLEGFSITKVSL